MHAFFAFYLKSKIIMRNVRNRGFKHCENTEQSSVFVCVFREVRDFIEVWIVIAHRVTVHRSDLVELLGLITCVCIWLGQVANLLDACAELRMSCAFRTGKFGKKTDKNVMSRCVCRNSKDGWNMRREKARWREMTHMQQTNFSWPWAMRVCDTHEKCAKVTVHALCAEKCTCNRWVYVQRKRAASMSSTMASRRAAGGRWWRRWGNSLWSTTTRPGLGEADGPASRGERNGGPSFDRQTYRDPKAAEVGQDSEGEAGRKTSDVGERERVEVFCGKCGNMWDMTLGWQVGLQTLQCAILEQCWPLSHACCVSETSVRCLLWCAVRAQMCRASGCSVYIIFVKLQNTWDTCQNVFSTWQLRWRWSSRPSCPPVFLCFQSLLRVATRIVSSTDSPARNPTQTLPDVIHAQFLLLITSWTTFQKTKMSWKYFSSFVSHGNLVRKHLMLPLLTRFFDTMAHFRFPIQIFDFLKEKSHELHDLYKISIIPVMVLSAIAKNLVDIDHNFQLSTESK